MPDFVAPATVPSAPSPSVTALLTWIVACLDQPAIVLDLKPKPKARPRVTRRGITYMPSDYVQWCRRCSEMFCAAGGDTLLGGPDQPVMVIAEFRMALPKRIGRKQRAVLAGTPHALKRGDVDNLAGALLDSIFPPELGGDHRVSYCIASKVWADTAGITVQVLPLDGFAVDASKQTDDGDE